MNEHPSPPVADNPRKALNLLTQPYLKGERRSLRGYDERRFGELFAFTEPELAQLNSLRELILRYVAQRSPPRPLCLAVFGPPGSGKSYGVKQVRAEVQQRLSKPAPELPITTINLTQVTQPGELGQILARIAGEQDEKTVPIIFLDEFDTTLGGARFGWLSWFLAPMHDGEFLHEGAIIRLRRAILIFAGGTASTMEEFEHSGPANEFRAAKGPDFISRLRGYLNVQGPNSHPRTLRRAVVLRSEIERRVDRFEEEAPGGVAARATFTVNRELVKSLLMAGRYRHGARSIGAVVELSDLSSGTKQFTWGNLPEDHLLALHIDRGPLDSKLIGGAVALSGFVGKASDNRSGPVAPSTSRGELVADCWESVAQALWAQGATLAYAGRWDSLEEKPLLQLLVGQQQGRTCEPSRQGRRANPRPWLESYLEANPDKSITQQADAIMPAKKRNRLGVKIVESTWNATEDDYSPEQRIIIERFRRRLAETEASIARFAVGGVRMRHVGRMPGIAEELMLTLAMGHPIYLAGAFGGAVEDVGTLLGLSSVRTGAVPASMKAVDGYEANLEGIEDRLRPPPWPELPVTKADAVEFFRERAIGGNKWPDNGLDLRENRQLFESRNVEEITELVIKGLLRLFNTSP